MQTTIRKIELKILQKLNRFYFNLSWKNRNRIDRILKHLRDKRNIYFDGLKPCYINRRYEYKENDDDRYYEMLELDLRNVFTGRKYTTNTFK